MLEGKSYRDNPERPLMDETDHEDWFALGDWVAAGEKFRASSLKDGSLSSSLPHRATLDNRSLEGCALIRHEVQDSTK
jgi:hypothetical protein